jgi:hypothetical protein
MKKLLIIFSSCLFLLSCGANKTEELKTQMSNLDAEKFELIDDIEMAKKHQMAVMELLIACTEVDDKKCISEQEAEIEKTKTNILDFQKKLEKIDLEYKELSEELNKLPK